MVQQDVRVVGGDPEALGGDEEEEKREEEELQEARAEGDLVAAGRLCSGLASAKDDAEAEAFYADDTANEDVAKVEPGLDIPCDVSSWPKVVLQNYVVLLCIHALQHA